MNLTKMFKKKTKIEATDSEFAVEFDNVVKTFTKNGKETKALNNVSFKIKQGKITALLGSSGAGKTTAARIINGLENYTSGKVFVNGILVNEKSQAKIRKNTAFVFQQFNLFPNMSVMENIIYAPIHVYKQDKEKTKKEAMKFLKQFGLENKADAYPNDLSGGQKQRVAIIRALILKPKILIMDEPTASLDIELTRDVIDMIRQISKLGLTIIVITHDIAVAKIGTDEILMMTNGKCVDIMKTEDFFNPSTKKSEFAKKFLEKCAF